MPYPAITGRQGIVNKLDPSVTVNYVLNDNGGAASAAAGATRVPAGS